MQVGNRSRIYPYPLSVLCFSCNILKQYPISDYSYVDWGHFMASFVMIWYSILGLVFITQPRVQTYMNYTDTAGNARFHFQEVLM